MKTPKWVGAAAGFMVAVSSTSSFAQTRPQLPPGAGPVPQVPIQPDPQYNRNNLLPEMTFRASMEARTPEQIERVNRANKIAELVDAGRCQEALTIAREARDRHMALRVRQLCH